MNLSPCPCVIRDNEGRKFTVDGWAVAFEPGPLQWTITPRVGQDGWTITEWTSGAHLPITGRTPEIVAMKAEEYFKRRPPENLVPEIRKLQARNKLLDAGETLHSIKLLQERERGRANKMKRKAA